MLALHLFIRHWRSGEWRLLTTAVALAVTVLSAIALFSQRLEHTLVQQGNSVLGADAVISGSQPLPPEWRQQAQQAHIRTAESISFNSVVYAGDAMQLAAIKAVSPQYPLRGAFEVAQHTAPNAASQVAVGIPAEGDVWVDIRMANALNVSLGSLVEVGYSRLRVAAILQREPDGLSPFSALGARLVMNQADVPAAQVLQPGSDAQYRLLLASNTPSALAEWLTALRPKLGDHFKVIQLESAQERLSNTLASAKTFLMLAAVIAVLLAGVAIALAAQHFAHKNRPSIALMKSLGLSAARVRRLYGVQLALLGLLASGLGLLLGTGVQAALIAGVEAHYGLHFAKASLTPFGQSLAGGLLCLAGFALPAVWLLPKVSPLALLRPVMGAKPLHPLAPVAGAVVAVVGLVFLFTQHWVLAGSLLAVVAGLVLAALAAAYGLMALAARALTQASGVWRLTLANWVQWRQQNTLALAVYAIGLLLMLTLVLVRGSLITQWQMQIPANAPNHYLANIPAQQVAALQPQLEALTAKPVVVMPNVRGRLISINQHPISPQQRSAHNALQRELNLTWAQHLPVANQVVQGQWWPNAPPQAAVSVSVEQDMAKALGLKLGDNLGFSIGGLALTAHISSIRSLDWRSMQLNHFFIFSPGALEPFSPTYIGSFHLTPTEKPALYRLLHAYPGVVLIEFDRILTTLLGITQQVAQGLQAVLMLTLAAGGLVLWAAVMGSLERRQQHAGLLRALGAPRRLLQGSLVLEFALMGALAGLLAFIGAEALLLSLQQWVFKLPLQWHPLYALLTPLVGAITLGVLGYSGCRRVVLTPPLTVLRSADGG